MEEQTKICTNCLDIHPFSAFFKDKTNKFGLSSHCKKCKNDEIVQRRLKRKEQVKTIPSNKRCPCCDQTKAAESFTRLKSSIDGLALYCKDCVRQKQIDRKKQVKINIVEINIDTIKKCTACEKEKKLTEFKVNRKSVDNFFHVCIECMPKSNWTKEKQHISEKKYRMNNPNKMKEKYKKQALNINRRIRDSLNHRISEALFTNNVTKNNKTVNYICCSIHFFKKWIEHLFQDNMSWDNYGKWHLDHVKPCASYDLSQHDHVKECFNWKNYQPLWKQDNLLKSDKINHELIKNHLEKANKYEICQLNSAQEKEGGLLE